MEEGWEAAVFSSIYLSPIQAESEPFHPREGGAGGRKTSQRESPCLIDIIS